MNNLPDINNNSGSNNKSDKKYSIYDLYKGYSRFKDIKELDERIKLYFDIITEAQLPLTYTGLMLVLGLNEKSALSNLRYDVNYGERIKSAIGAIENSYETRLADSKCIGAIFALKNMGWSDAQQVSLNSGDNPAALQRTQAQLAILQNLRNSKEGQQ